MRQLRMCLLGLLLLVAAPAVLCQQLGTGAITGSVVDSNGAAIVGATVKVTNTATGVVRTVTTNNAGQFNAPVLPAGKYTVTIEQTGFSKLEQQNLEVNVGASISLNLEMKAGGATETINITAQPELDTTKTEESSLINRTQINDLPINGRRFDQFALLAPGVTRDGRFGLLSYHGQSGVFNNFTIEGNDDNQALNSEARGRTRIASSVSANAIQEFQVEQSNFLAEFGRSAGGGVNATIRSGANQTHGDAFYYFRNKGFNARDPLAAIRPEEKRQQFGGSVSGAIRQDKAFFFVNYDQQLRNFPIVVTDTGGAFNNLVPDAPPVIKVTAADRASFLAGCTDMISRVAAIKQFTPNPAVLSVSNCTALSTGAIVASSQFLGTEAREANQNSFLAKVDVNIDQRNTLSVTYNYLNARSPEGIQTGIVIGSLGGNGSDDVRLHSANVRLTSTLDSTKVNEMRFQFGRDFEFEFSDQNFPAIFIGGTFGYGVSTSLQRPAFPDERRLQYVDNFSYTRGRHSFKFGGEVNRVKDIINNPRFFSGNYVYGSLTTYGRDIQNPATHAYTSYNQNFGLPGPVFSTTDYAAFAQDQFKLSRRLTLNYGIRYDYQQLPRPIAPNSALPLTTSFNADHSNWGPRIGVAYDLTGSGKTVIRAGYGIYYGRTQNGILQDVLQLTGLTDLSRATTALSLQPTATGAPSFPNVLASPVGIPAASTPKFLAAGFQRPRLNEFNVGIQRELGRSMVLSASFVYTKGDRLPVNIDANLPAATGNIFNRTFQLPDGSTFTTPYLAFVTRTAAGTNININSYRPNPAFGAIVQVTSIGETWYRAMFVELRKRLSNNLQFGIAYTYAKAENLVGTDNGGGTGSENAFGGATVIDQFSPLENGRARSPLDQRHRFVANGIYNFPKAETSSQAFNSLINGFRLSGIFTAEAGRPFPSTITVNTVSFILNGATFNGFGGLLGQGGAGNLLPTVPRNNNTGRSNYKVDLRLSRDISLSERMKLELIGEGFNLFNRSNFNGFNTVFAVNNNGTLTAPAGSTTPPVVTLSAPPAVFGSPNNDAAPPDGTNARRFQVAVRFRF